VAPKQIPAWKTRWPYTTLLHLLVLLFGSALAALFVHSLLKKDKEGEDNKVDSDLKLEK